MGSSISPLAMDYQKMLMRVRELEAQLEWLLTFEEVQKIVKDHETEKKE